MDRREFLAATAALAVAPATGMAQSASTSAAASAAASALSSAYAPPFPRLAAYIIGGAFNYNDPTYQASIAKLNFSVLTYYPSLAPGGESMNVCIQAIKALNPNTSILLYVKNNEMETNDEAYSAFISKINDMNWWLYPVGQSGTPVSAGSYGQEINNTLFTAKDSSGLNSVDWMSQWFVQNIYGPNSAADGFYMDNFNWQPTVAGDWSLSGVTAAITSTLAGTWCRQGYARYVQDVRQAMPGKLQIGNVATWGMPQAVLTEYEGILDGGAIESIIGQTYSIESYGGWQAMISYYRQVMATLGGPKLAIFAQDGNGNSTDYQGMRYGLASCLMDNGYYYYTSPSYDTVNWFDEFNASLGQSVTSPPTAAWQSGVYRRDFQNGIALVNPKGNGAQTVKLETSFVKLNGTQVPSINNGSTVTTATLADRDGLILLRQTPVTQPKSPTNLSAG